MNEKPADIIEDLTMVSPATIWTWLLPVLLGLIACAIVALFLIRRHRLAKLAAIQSAPPPDVAARESLAASRKLLDDGLYREFVIEVSRVLRIYIEDRFALRAPHLSTEEFLFEAERSERLTTEWRNHLGDFLFQCDKVKFALANTEPPRMEALYSTAERFIDETASKPEPPATNNGTNPQPTTAAA